MGRSDPVLVPRRRLRDRTNRVDPQAPPPLPPRPLPRLRLRPPRLPHALPRVRCRPRVGLNLKSQASNHKQLSNPKEEKSQPRAAFGAFPFLLLELVRDLVLVIWSFPRRRRVK